jgi:hypothetical protein
MLAVAGLIAFSISYLTSLSFLGIFGITVVAIIVNGFIAKKEDELPGGFNSPSEKDATKNDD